MPYTPGSPVDVLARAVTQHAAARLGQSFAIDNRPGAGTTIGTKVAAIAEPDGYTLLMGATSFVLSSSLYPNLDYHPLKSLTPVAMLAHAPSIPANTVREFIAYARADDLVDAGLRGVPRRGSRALASDREGLGREGGIASQITALWH